MYHYYCKAAKYNAYTCISVG